MHRWEEVTAAGLLLLAAARTARSSTRSAGAGPAVLVYGACDGLLASFLAQHAPEATGKRLSMETAGARTVIIPSIMVTMVILSIMVS